MYWLSGVSNLGYPHYPLSEPQLSHCLKRIFSQCSILQALAAFGDPQVALPAGPVAVQAEEPETPGVEVAEASVVVFGVVTTQSGRDWYMRLPESVRQDAELVRAGLPPRSPMPAVSSES